MTTLNIVLSHALAAQVLVDRGHEVTQADSGQAALDHLAVTPIDVVVLDVNMPGLSGWDVLEQLTVNHPDISVILTSGYADEARALKLGAASVLPKPYRLPELVVAVEQVIAGSAREQSGD